jgi:hypothetical protein
LVPETEVEGPVIKYENNAFGGPVISRSIVPSLAAHVVGLAVTGTVVTGDGFIVRITESLKKQEVIGSVIVTSYSNVGGPGTDVSTLCVCAVPAGTPLIVQA